MDPQSAGKQYSYESEELIKRVAWMYYEDELNQQEIADKLKLSRTKVLRLLKDSREMGFVRINLDVQTGLVFALEKKICQLTGMKECFIVPSGNNVLTSVAKALAYRFKEALRSCESIGMGAGRTLHAFVRELDPPEKIATKEIISLFGNTKANLALEPYDIGYSLIAKLPVECFQLWAPAKVAGNDEAQLILQTPSIRTVLQKANNVDVAFVGIGDMHNSSFLRYGYLDDEELRVMRENGAVGEILGRFFNINGAPLEKDFNQKYISISLPMRNPMIGVAGGVEKTSAIVGAVRTGWLSGLITDEVTANALVRAYQKEKRGSAL